MFLLCSSHLKLYRGEKVEKELTDRTKNDDNQKAESPNETTAPLDPRIVEIVRFLARRAAEKDFAEAVARQENNKNEDGKD